MVIGLFRIIVLNEHSQFAPDLAQQVGGTFQPLTAILLLLLKAFAGGSVALTGTEAIANGVPAFKPPEAKNAANTMTAMSILLGILFVGLTLFAVQYGLRPTNPGGPSVVALAAQAAFGDGSILFVTFAASTALILFLAANTSFNAFPRLAAILAEDGYMPRQFSFRGDRLAYSWGIVLLAAIAFGLLWAFGATPTRSSRCTRSASSSTSR